MSLNKFKPEAIHETADWAIRAYNLQEAWAFVRAFHTFGLGYHNLDHLHTTVGAAAWLAAHEGVDPRLPVIAAMFHDMGHTGKQPDNLNTDLAVQWVTRARELKIGWRVLNLTEEDFTVIADSIKSTTFMEGKFPFEPTTPVARVLRDADLWNIHLNDSNMKHMITGLGLELGAWDWRERKRGIIGSYEFFEKITWFTNTAQSIADRGMKNLARIVEEVDPEYFRRRERNERSERREPIRKLGSVRSASYDDDEGDDDFGDGVDRSHNPPKTAKPVALEQGSEGGEHD